MLWFAPPVLALLQSGPSQAFGTDPTIPLTRFELVGRHLDERGGGSLDSVSSRFDLALSERFVLRAELPLAYADPVDHSSDVGLGDLRVQAGWRAFEDPVFAMFFGAGVVLDTAGGDALGAGHDQLVLQVSGSGALPEIRSYVFETVEHFVSFDGSSDQPGVALTKLDVHMMTEWSPNAWTQFGGELFIDWKGGEHTGLNLDVELGGQLRPGMAVWVEPAVGLFGEDVPGVVDWSITVGMRWVF